MTTASEWSPQSDVQLVRATMELFKGTSLTSNTIASTGTLTFTTQTYLYFDEGKWLEIISNSDSTKWMAGQVTSYNELTGVLVFEPKVKAGTGTFADWLIYSSGVWVNDPWNGGTVANAVTINNTLAVTGTATVAKVVASAQLNSTAGDTNLCVVTPLADASATLTFAQIFNGVLTIAPTTARVLTLPSAATIIAALTGYEVGSHFEFTVLNTSTSTVTVAPGAGVLMNGRTLFTEGSTTFLVRVDSPTVVSVFNTSQATTESNGVPGQISDGVTRVLNSLNGVASWGASGISSVSSTVTTDTTLTSASEGYQFVQMAAMGKSLTLPNATTMTVGGPKFIIDNTQGSYPCGIRNSAGTLLMAVAAGGEAYVSIKSVATAAGAWSITGTNLEPGLITVDNTFSSTYSANVQAPFAALDDNKSIHFLKNTSNDLYAVAVDKTTGAVGTPVLVKVATTNVRSAFKVSTTTAIAFYDDGSANSRAVIISLSGATTLAVGTEASVATYGYWTAENFSGAPKIVQLTSTLYLASYTSGTNTTVVAVSVSGTTVTIGSPANIITANSVSDSTTTYALTATTALVLYKEGAGSPYTNKAVVISVSGTTCTVGTPASADTQNSTNPAASCMLSATKGILLSDANQTNVNARAITVSGTTVTFGSPLTVEAAVISSSLLVYTGDSATRYNPHLFPLSASTALLWYLNSSSISRAVVLSESGGTVTAGSIVYRGISNAASTSAGYGIILPQGTDHFVSITQAYDNSAGAALSFNTAKIASTIITQGGSIPASEFGNTNSLVGVNVAKLANGKYAVRGGQSNKASIKCFESNGDFFKSVGDLAIPAIGVGVNIPMLPVVGTNRFVLMGAHERGSATSSSDGLLRLITVEIAA